MKRKTKEHPHQFDAFNERKNENINNVLSLKTSKTHKTHRSAPSLPDYSAAEKSEQLVYINDSILPETQKFNKKTQEKICKIQSNKITTYYKKVVTNTTKSDFFQLPKNTSNQKYTGILTDSAAKKIKNLLDIWINAIMVFNIYNYQRFERKKTFITFATLTLPAKQNHTDKEIARKIFTPFIDKIKYHFRIEAYFYRAERQQNGNIHYHVLFDRYVKFEDLKNLWNQTTEKLNYITEFEKIHHHRSPNSVDIRTIPNLAHIQKYITKYVVKNESIEKIEGRVWFCSHNISNLKPFTTNNYVMIMALLDYIQNVPSVRVYANDFANLYYLQNSLIATFKTNPLISQYYLYHVYIYIELYESRHPNLFANDNEYRFDINTFISQYMQYLSTMKRKSAAKKQNSLTKFY